MISGLHEGGREGKHGEAGAGKSFAPTKKEFNLKLVAFQLAYSSWLILGDEVPIARNLKLRCSLHPMQT